MRRTRLPFLSCFLWLLLGCFAAIGPVKAQGYRFTLRAEPEVIPANGISTTSIFVQVPQTGGAISSAPIVRFATTAGVIESTAQLNGGIARVLLRSSTTPGTAVVTAFVGASREAVTVEFSNDAGMAERYLEVSAPYVAYGAGQGVVTSSGKTLLDFGETRIESDTRLDVDLYAERVWAQGNVSISHGRGDKKKTLRGDRLFYDLRRRRGVMRRADMSQGPARQEFVGSSFLEPSGEESRAPVQPGAGSSPSGLAVPPALGVQRLTADEAEAPQGSPQGAAQSATRLLVKPVDAAAANSPEARPEAQEDATPEKGDGQPAGVTGTIAPVTAAGNDATPSPDAPAAGDPAAQETRVRALVTMPQPPRGEAAEGPQTPPAYEPLPADSGFNPRIVELPPPSVSPGNGYWVAARRLRVFPRDKVQFERATIFFNGGKVYRAPLYVLPLDGSFNPTTDMVSFTSVGGVNFKFPLYYQASDRGTGTLYVKHEPGGGFSSGGTGFALALNQQYTLSPRSNGSFDVDQLGHGAWNLRARHEMQFSPSLVGNFFVNSPRHQDVYTQFSLVKDLKSMQVGVETYYDRPRESRDNTRGQFFARMRPRNVGKSGWTYTNSANFMAVQRVSSTVTRTTGGGIGIPGQGGTTVETITRPLFGQTLTSSLQSPTYSPWRGSGFNANLFATAYNYSNGRRGMAPGVNFGWNQSLGQSISVRLDYTYDRSAIGLYGITSDSFTHYVSGSVSAALTRKLGFTSFVSKSLQDGTVYGSSDLTYRFGKRWRTGLFADYTGFTDISEPWNYGWSIGRMVANREVSLNYDAVRDKVYFQLGSARY